MNKSTLIDIHKTNIFDFKPIDIKRITKYIELSVKRSNKALVSIKTFSEIKQKNFSGLRDELTQYRLTLNSYLRFIDTVDNVLSQEGITQDDYNIVFLYCESALPHNDIDWKGQRFFSKVLTIKGCDHYQFNTFTNHRTNKDSKYVEKNVAHLEEGTELVCSNFTTRWDKYFPGRASPFYKNKVVVAGIQGTWKEIVAIWKETFFDKPKQEVLDYYADHVWPFTGAEGPKQVAIKRLGELHDLGYLPITLKALKEGSLVSLQIPIYALHNNLRKFSWLTNSLETWLSNESWGILATATIAHEYRKIIDYYALKTGSPKEFTEWQGHCFADRGMFGMMAAGKGGAGHSFSFAGTDSVTATHWLKWAYGGEFMYGSAPATEHAVMCVDGKESEIETFRRLIKLYPTGVFSVVSDTWDFWNVVGLDNSIAMQLKDEILARKSNSLGLCKVVFRPDSGDPVKVLTGYKIYTMPDNIWYEIPLDQLYREGWEAYKENDKYFKIIQVDDDCFRAEEMSESEAIGAVECLYRIFGGTLTDKGYKVLDSHVGLIYGDSITIERAIQIFERLVAKGFASCNVVLGIGSYTYQYITRDSQGGAIKATFAIVDGTHRNLFKEPKTDLSKKSACGLIRVDKDENGDYYATDKQTWESFQEGELVKIFENMFIKDKFVTVQEIKDTLTSYRNKELEEFI